MHVTWSLVFPIVVSTCAIVGPIKVEIKVQRVAFGPQPHDRLAHRLRSRQIHHVGKIVRIRAHRR